MADKDWVDPVETEKLKKKKERKMYTLTFGVGS